LRPPRYIVSNLNPGRGPAIDTALWKRRLRWFFVATSGLFGYADGIEWGVSHFRMKVAA
jgi:hypothetical protein